MESLFLIILFAVVGSIISALSKSKKKSGTQNEQEQPMRTMPLSDIQKAFMMREDTPAPPVPPRPADAPPAYVPPQPLQSQLTARLAPAYVSQPSMPPRPAAQAATGYKLASADYVGSLGPVSTEGGASATDINLETVTSSDLESVKDISLESVTEIPDFDYRIPDLSVPEKSREGKSDKTALKPVALKLFENKSEYAKAVIYSEILTRRSPGRRAVR